MSSKQFDPAYAYITSPLASPKTLGCIRLAIAFYALFTLVYSLAYQGGRTFFSYFTHLTYTGMCAWFWASGLQTVVWAFWRKGGSPKYLLRSWPRPLQWAHEWLWSTIFSFPIIVTIVYWTLLSPSLSEPVDAWSSISMHALNMLFCLCEILLTNNPAPRWIWLPVNIVVLALYLGLAYLSKETIGFYVYPFLDPAQGALLAGYIIGIGAAEVVVFCLMLGVLRVRQRLVKTKAPAQEDDSFELALDVQQAPTTPIDEKTLPSGSEA